MTYDLAYRFQQALDPSALTTLTGALHPVGGAMEDCRRAGKRAEDDPGVLLLIRHLGSLASGRGGDDTALRHGCMAAIGELRRKPLLITLAARGVDYDAEAKKHFHGEARRALKALADALGYDKTDYDLRSNLGGPAVSGEITMHSAEAYVQVSCGGFRPGGEVMFRRCRGRRDYSGLQNRYASIRELINPGVFAARLCRELGLATPATDARLVA